MTWAYTWLGVRPVDKGEHLAWSEIGGHGPALWRIECDRLMWIAFKRRSEAFDLGLRLEVVHLGLRLELNGVKGNF